MTASSGPVFVMGLGVTGRAVTGALVRRGWTVRLADDRPSPEAQALADGAGAELLTAPRGDELDRVLDGAVALLPAPGLPARHPVFVRAAELGVPVWSEFDLADLWDRRPVLAVTGTDGKTTVTTLVTEMLRASGLVAQAVGNTEVPLVTAIDDPDVDVFVVEASSFRLAFSRYFAPTVGTWLNFAPDHLDNHRDLAEYEAAKARIWRDQAPEQVAVGSFDDPVVARHLARAPGRHVTFGRGEGAGYRVVDGVLVTDKGEAIVPVDRLPRSFPHDVLNGLAAAATALPGGATLDGVRVALENFRGLPHRIALVGEAGGVRYFDDSKATTPHAAATAVAGFDSVVLICGGRNKGLDLSVLAEAARPVRSVVAIGEAASEVRAAFDGVRPVATAASMDEAVAMAADVARPGDAVLLSPGCASFDWYGNYHQRGEDFERAVHASVAAG